MIQDKTFVPTDILTEDAKWDTTHWGQPGDLWFPHVYMPNQNPNSDTGALDWGRWDYGPWFWPIFGTANQLLAALAQLGDEDRAREIRSRARSLASS